MRTLNIYNNLAESLKLVASSYDIQIESLPDFVNVTDEIALIFNDSYIMIPQIDRLLSSHTMRLLDDLNKLFEKMSEDKSLWNIESLEKNDLWIKSRELGCLILKEINEKYTDPNLDFINWIN